MIDRYKLVSAHNPVLKSVEIESPLTVGNGEFAFTADITGLQTFSDLYEDEVPLCTMAQWGWHSFRNDGYDRKKLELEDYQAKDRVIAFASQERNQEDLFNYLRENPHKFHLGQIGLDLRLSDGSRVSIENVEDIRQELNLWEGSITSSFAIEGKEVLVKTICHPERDILALSIESELMEKGRLFVDIKFSYPSIDKSAANWNQAEKHKTKIIRQERDIVDFLRIMDDDKYFLSLYYPEEGEVVKKDKHYYQYKNNRLKFSFTVEFSQNILRKKTLGFKEVEKASKDYWYGYWTDGGIIDLSENDSLKAHELERRIILSQYLTAVNCSGSYPPQETGLTCSSWYGKFHLEMHFWHAAHFPLWNRARFLEKSLWWYHSIFDRAKELASSQGYKGVRWPKMLGPAGFDSPSSIGPFLIWQQPHPIIYAELLYRHRIAKNYNSDNHINGHNNKKNILELYQDIVFESAEFMVSFADYDNIEERFVLGPPLIPAQENHKPEDVFNPTFELEYWHFALNIAQKWRERLGLRRKNEWQKVIDRLSQLPVKDDVYLAHENCLKTFEEKNFDHPSMVGAFGLLPGSKVNKDIMMNTLKKCLNEWRFDDVWGWDFPMMAMTAARLGEKDLAVDLLLMDSPKNIYLPNGHNVQGMRKDLPLYLPGNGALLLASGMMAAGWSDSPAVSTPGFPDNKSWHVKYEDINKYF